MLRTMDKKTAIRKAVSAIRTIVRGAKALAEAERILDGDTASKDACKPKSRRDGAAPDKGNTAHGEHRKGPGHD